MLFILTGDVQIGKTRWLTKLVDELCDAHISCYGTLAPGKWVLKDSQKREKIGIDNILLPQNESLPFAVRRDLVQDSTGASQSAQAGLGWEIRDHSITKVNNHYKSIADQATATSEARPGLLVIDELGRLELLEGKGLSEALSLVKRGPTVLYEHGLIVVRKWLLDKAVFHVESSWGKPEIIEPQKANALSVRQLFND